MTKKWWVCELGLLLLIAGCATLESGGEFTAGRRALMSGDYAVALSYFEPIAKRDPNYVRTLYFFQRKHLDLSRACPISVR